MRQNLFVLLFVIMSVSLYAQKKKNGIAGLPLQEMAIVNDSVIKEGHILYFYEKINWNCSDLLMTTNRLEDLGGNLTYMMEDSVMSAFFCDKDIANTICELRWDMRKMEYIPSTTPRPLTEMEKNLVVRYQQLKRKINDVADSINGIPSDFGEFNFDIIPINENVTRLYILSGTIQNDMIPIGNDYSIDFDNDNNIIAFRRYHNSLLAISAKYDGEYVETFTHSHLKNNPYITPTDICNFLLWARDLYGMKAFIVNSTALQCVFIYQDEIKSILTVTGTDKKKKKKKK